MGEADLKKGPCPVLPSLSGSQVFPLTLGDCPHSPPGHKLVGRPLGPVLGVHHEEHVRETSAEVRAVCVVVPRGLGCVHVHTLGAVELHHGFPWDVRKAWKTVRLSMQAPLTMPKLTPKHRLQLAEPQLLPRGPAIYCPSFPTLTDGKHWLVLTVHTWTVAKVSLLVFFQLR